MDALTTEHYAGKRPARHFKRFKGLKPGKRQACTPEQQRLACEVGRFACGSGASLGLLGYLFPAELGGLVEGVERLERLRPGKWQP